MALRNLKLWHKVVIAILLAIVYTLLFGCQAKRPTVAWDNKIVEAVGKRRSVPIFMVDKLSDQERKQLASLPIPVVDLLNPKLTVDEIRMLDEAGSRYDAHVTNGSSLAVQEAVIKILEQRR